MIREVLDVMADLSAESITNIVVTHKMGFAKHAVSQIMFMESGEIIETPAAKTLFSAALSTNERDASRTNIALTAHYPEITMFTSFLMLIV